MIYILAVVIVIVIIMLLLFIFVDEITLTKDELTLFKFIRKNAKVVYIDGVYVVECNSTDFCVRGQEDRITVIFDVKNNTKVPLRKEFQRYLNEYVVASIKKARDCNLFEQESLKKIVKRLDETSDSKKKGK